MVIAVIIAVIAILVAVYCAISKKKVDTAAEEANRRIYEERDMLKAEVSKLDKNVINLRTQRMCIEEELVKQEAHLELLQENIQKTLNNQTELSQKAFENYCDILYNQYEKTEIEYDELIETLKESYSNIQFELMREADEIRTELDKIRNTRAAAIEAERREKELENNLTFYCLQISEAEKADIAKLEALKPSLNKPRVLSMLIWQTWFQKPLKALAAQVIGTNDKMGIYKITNIKTKECYIGQAISIKDRWAEHAKCGLGIDTPVGNKLYKAIQEYGLWNFSFEVLEECPREQLNEKEKYYIDLYSSYEFGYNSNRGINK